MPRPLRLLLVEDSDDDAALVLRELSRGGFDVEHLRVDTEPAMRRELDGRPWDLILSDHSMPLFSAPRALAILHESGRDIPFIIVSGTIGEETAVESMRAGAHDFVVKANLRRLLPAVERELREAAHRAERRLADRARQVSEARFRELIERLPDLVLIHREGAIVYVNAAAVRALGYAMPMELVGRSLAEFIHPDERHAASEWLSRVPTSDDAAVHQEQRWLHRAGSSVIVEVMVEPLSFGEGWALALVARDVTEQRKLQSQLLLADRMVSMGTLAAGVAHEINNPLLAVLVNLDLAQRDLTAARKEVASGNEAADVLATLLAKLNEPLADSRLAADRVRAIVRDLMLLARSDETRHGPVDIVQVLETTLRMARNEVRHRAREVRDFAPGVPPVLGNEGRLGQLFLNLVVNAAHAITAGHVTENEVRISVRSAGDRVVVEVRDTGSGIDPTVLPRIFDPFFTTKPVGLGTGLGLAIAHRIVSESGGTLAVESEVGKGTLFRVELPVARESTDEAMPQEARTPARARGVRVLVVDDEEIVRKVVERALQDEGDVVGLASARHALERLERGDRFDIILCDLMMPELTGMEFYDELERRDPAQAVRVVFLTGGAFTAQARTFIEARKVPLLEKPFRVDELVDLVRSRTPEPA